MQPVLIYIRPLDTRTNARVDIRIADGPDANTFGIGGVAWDPAVLSRPKLSIELMSPDMDGKVQAGQATFEVALRQVTTPGEIFDLYWKGASVVIHSTGALEGATAVPDFWGYITSAQLDLDTGRMSVTAEVSTAFIDKPLLTKEFTGAGGIDGDAARRGVLLPAGFGTVKNIQPVWFDLTRNIGMIDGYANCISIDWLGEGLSSFGARVADYATYELLAAAIDAKAIKPGQWGTCVAKGLVGLGAPPTGIISVHAVFGTNRIGAMMKRIILTHAAVNAFYVDAIAFDALDALVPLPVHYWTDQQRNVKDMLEALAQSCNATPIVSFQNLITVTRAIGGPIVGTLDRSGSVEPRVIDWQFADIEPPYYLIKGRAARPASVLTDDQVNYVDKLEDVGVYNAATIYSAGNLVWLADGSQWLYQNATPSAGHTPPVAAPPDGDGNVQDAWWFRRQPPTLAVNVKYADGTPLEALKPGEAGANITETRTSAAITGQGPGATAPGYQVFNNNTDGGVLLVSAPVGGSISSGSGTTGALKIRLPQSWSSTMMRFDVEIYEYNGAASTTYTIGGYNYDGGPGSRFWVNTFATMIGADAKRRTVRFGHDGTACCIWIGEPGDTWEYPKAKISNFYGGHTNNAEASWATGWVLSFSTVAAANVTSTITSPNPGEARYGINILESAGVAAVLAAFKTILGTASAITGQGAFATVNTAAYGSGLLTGFGALAPLGELFFGSSLLREASGGAGATLNNFKTILGTSAAITGQAPAATDATVEGGATNDKFADTRNVNSPPSFYLGTLRDKREFKIGSVIGIPGATSGIFGALTTTNDYADLSGGQVKQYWVGGNGAYIGIGYVRTSTSTSAWGAWEVDYTGLRKPAFGTDLTETVGGTVATLSLFKTGLGTAAAITGQGPGATATAAQVLNNLSEGSVLRVPAPSVGAVAGPSGQAGALKIRLPVGFTNTMLRFAVDIYEYQGGTSTTFEVGGYTYQTNQWLNTFANMIGPDARRRTVRFGHDTAGYCCIWIGELNGTWEYPQVRVRDLVAGYSSFAEATWASGWVVSFDTVGNPAAVSATIENPNAGEAKFGVNLLESSGVPATLANFKTSSGTAAAIAGQGTLATAPALNQSNVHSYFNVNTWSLNYTIKRQDGSTTVTESLAITSLGISAGFTGQGSMATQNASGVAITGGSININNKFIVASDGTTTIQAATSGERTVINTQGLRTYDSAGNWTVKVGDLS